MDLTLKVIDYKDEVLSIKVGPWTMDLTKEILKQYMDASLHDPTETIIRNLALRLKLAKVNSTSKAELRASLDNIVFKVVD
jgi:hypothetical protein